MKTTSEEIIVGALSGKPSRLKRASPDSEIYKRGLDGRLLQTLQGVYEASSSAEEETRKGVGEPNRATHQLEILNP